jgi:flagellar motor protein MotB
MLRAAMKTSGAVVALAMVATLVGGCAQSRSRDRSKILAAENTDLRQRSDMLSGQLQGALSAQDRATAELQVKESQLRDAQAQAAEADAAKAQAAQLEQAYADAQRVAAAQAAEAERLRQMNQKLVAEKSRPAPGPAPVDHRDSAEVEALRRDVSDRLARAGVDVPVEVRTTRAGARKVAVVLQDAYPSGSDSLAKNAKAVEAVAKLSQVIQQSYPGSKVHIEGHTDSDPIRVSKWPSNDALALARADTVKKLLMTSGLSENAIETEGVGSRNPLAKGGTARAKASNRRVEIYISPR